VRSQNPEISCAAKGYWVLNNVNEYHLKGNQRIVKIRPVNLFRLCDIEKGYGIGVVICYDQFPMKGSCHTRV